MCLQNKLTVVGGQDVLSQVFDDAFSLGWAFCAELQSNLSSKAQICSSGNPCPLPTPSRWPLEDGKHPLIRLVEGISAKKAGGRLLATKGPQPLHSSR